MAGRGPPSKSAAEALLAQVDPPWVASHLARGVCEAAIGALRSLMPQPRGLAPAEGGGGGPAPASGVTGGPAADVKPAPPGTAGGADTTSAEGARAVGARGR